VLKGLNIKTILFAYIHLYIFSELAGKTPVALPMATLSEYQLSRLRTSKELHCLAKR
jgi:hypothetical protein